MQKLFLTSLFLFFTWIFFPSSLFAASCNINTANQCGSLGGCPQGQKCQYDIQGNFYCSVDSTCPSTSITCGTSNNTVGNCGPSAGCRSGEMCWYDVQGTNLCVQSDSCVLVSPTPSTTPTTAPTATSITSSISPSPAPLPTIEPIESTGLPCSSLGNNTVYPPNSSCYADVKAVETDILQYPLTCIPAPEVTYKAEISGETPPSTITVSLITDLSDATLGFLGPDSNSLSSTNPDQLAKKYLFSGLFDRPSYSQENTPRELFRTYWRMLNSQVQANIKAAYLSAANTQSTKLTYFYLDSNLEQQETDTATLFSELPRCLRRYPVCDEYREKYAALSPNIRTRYDTLLPFDFNNNRSYIALLGNISKESVPYLSAILHGLGGKNGLLSFYTPNWMLPSTSSYSTIPASLENTLYPTLSNADLFSSCTISKSTSAPAPKTFPVSSSLSQNITIPLKSEFISSTPSYCYDTGDDLPRCRNVDCSLYDDNPNRCRLNETKGCCYFVEGTTKYELTGRATGRHATVFNNPLINTINELVVGKDQQNQSAFYHMLLPSFAPKVEKNIISAPSVQVSTDNGNTTVSNNGSSSIYRENALAQNAMQSLQNCWLVPSDQQTSSKCGSATPTTGECKLSEEPLTGTCSKAAFSRFAVARPYIMSVPNVSPELSAVYAEAEKQTGVSCVVLAAVHFMEGGNNPCQSLISGRKIGEPEPDKGGKVYNTLLETAIDAGQELFNKGAYSFDPQTGLILDNSYENVITALSNYNGGGNSNCRSDPPASNYGHCPAQFTGEDDPYAMSWYDQNHANMFLRCPRDGYCGASIPFHRPGAFTVALSYYLSLP